MAAMKRSEFYGLILLGLGALAVLIGVTSVLTRKYALENGLPTLFIGLVMLGLGHGLRKLGDD